MREMEAHVATGEDFATETTLSGRAYAKRIRRWQAAGYRVTLVYLRLPSADHSVARVARRVREGGHHIPEPVIRRRFERSWRNFRDLYRKVVDDWRVYDNSGDVPVLVEESEGMECGPRVGREVAANKSQAENRRFKGTSDDTAAGQVSRRRTIGQGHYGRPRPRTENGDAQGGRI